MYARPLSKSLDAPQKTLKRVIDNASQTVSVDKHQRLGLTKTRGPTMTDVAPPRHLVSLTPEQRVGLLTVGLAAGRAYRSNYTANGHTPAGWQVYWRMIDRLLELGLITRVGRFYHLSLEGERLVGMAKIAR